MYDSEAAFSSALLTALKTRAKRLLVQRIESGETARGIPDLYVRNNWREYWIELKNVKRLSIYSALWQIPWRPGQKTWASHYHRCSGLYSYSIIALRDGYMLVEMNNRFKNNTVYRDQQGSLRMTALADVVNCIVEGLEKYGVY